MNIHNAHTCMVCLLLGGREAIRAHVQRGEDPGITLSNPLPIPYPYPSNKLLGVYVTEGIMNSTANRCTQHWYLVPNSILHTHKRRPPPPYITNVITLNQ